MVGKTEISLLRNKGRKRSAKERLCPKTIDDYEEIEVWRRKGGIIIFRSTNNKGFHIKFQNGVCVSVQYGPGNYCEHYIGWNEDFIDNLDAPQKSDTWESNNAEVAIWIGDIWITHEFAQQTERLDDYSGNRMVLDRFTPEQVLEVLNWAKEYGVE